MYVSNVLNLILFFFVVVRKVAAGHQMIAKGHSTVAQGWQLFKEAVEETGPGDLPQFLGQLKGKMTLTAMEAGQQQQEREVMPPPSPSPVKKEPGSGSKEPVIVMMGDFRKWVCPQCNTVWGSHNRCDAHIRQVHTGKALVCAFCSFSSYNLDLMQRHEKEHK